MKICIKRILKGGLRCTYYFFFVLKTRALPIITVHLKTKMDFCVLKTKGKKNCALFYIRA